MEGRVLLPIKEYLDLKRDSEILRRLKERRMAEWLNFKEVIHDSIADPEEGTIENYVNTILNQVIG